MSQLNTLPERFAILNDFPAKEWEFYEKYAEHVQYHKKGLLTSMGEVENYIYFIKSGAVRSYFIKDKREICVDFGFENDFVSAYTSFLTRLPSDVHVQALSHVQAMRVHYQFVYQMSEISKLHERFGRVIAERLYMNKPRREMQLLSHSAEENYRDLIENHPEVVKYIPVKDIASYLGIHPESLSRIRKNMH